MFIEFINALLYISSKLGYAGIVFLMAVESSFVPFPSEVVIPPAAYLAQQGEMNIFLVIAAGIFGSLIGAAINYFLALTLGRKIIHSLARRPIARLFLINEEKVIKSEKYFLQYGRSSTFFGRLIPVIRQLISIPAGFSKMNFLVFMFYTGLGSGIWIIILAILGYWFGANQEVLHQYYSQIKVAAIILVLAAAAYIVWKKWGKKKNNILNSQ
jgi:membrane protein DedA with SNARE-associated domain